METIITAIVISAVVILAVTLITGGIRHERNASSKHNDEVPYKEKWI